MSFKNKFNFNMSDKDLINIDVKAKEKFGSFRLALLPIGAYEPRWFMKYSHMNPEEMIKAHIDLGSPYTIPSHYDVFELADEPRGEALKNLEKAKNDLNKGNKIKNIHPGEFWMVPKIWIKYNKRSVKNSDRGLIPNRTDINLRDKIIEEKSRIGD